MDGVYKPLIFGDGDFGGQVAIGCLSGIPSDKSQMHSLDAGISGPWKHTTNTAALDFFGGHIWGFPKMGVPK